MLWFMANIPKIQRLNIVITASLLPKPLENLLVNLDRGTEGALKLARSHW